MGADGWVSSLAYGVYQMLSLLPCTDTANGAASHNRGEVAATPPLARTQCRTVGRTLDFNFVGPFFWCLLRVLRPYNGKGPKCRESGRLAADTTESSGSLLQTTPSHRATCPQSWEFSGEFSLARKSMEPSERHPRAAIHEPHLDCDH